MRTKKKLPKRQKIFKRIIISALAFIIAIVVFYEFTVRDRLELSIVAQIKTVCNKTINNAVSEYLKENQGACKQMVEVSCDESSAVKSISENIYAVNLLKTDIINVTQTAVDDVLKLHGIDVKLGNFTGLTILSDSGPYIHLDIDATSTITCDINSTFESSGVNQTLHRVTLDMYVDVYVGNPFRIESIFFETSYEIYQTIIVVNAPSAYGSISTRY